MLVWQLYSMGSAAAQDSSGPFFKACCGSSEVQLSVKVSWFWTSHEKKKKKLAWEHVRASSKPKATRGSALRSAQQHNIVCSTCKPVAKVFSCCNLEMNVNVLT